jgi:hypothetical protein
MGDTWVTDMRHYLDEEGCLPETIPGPALNIALFLGSIVGWVTSHHRGTYEQTNVPCRRTPGHRRCVGDIHARLEPDGAAISWECPICGDNGFVRGWQDTLWDRRNA